MALQDELKVELSRLESEIGKLQDRRRMVEVLLGEQVKAAKPVKAKAAQKASPKAELKAKGWPKGMPRDKAKRAAWFETEAGKQYLAENPGSKAQ